MPCMLSSYKYEIQAKPLTACIMNICLIAIDFFIFLFRAALILRSLVLLFIIITT